MAERPHDACFTSIRKIVQEVRTADYSRLLCPYIQGYSRSVTYPIENLYTRLPISD